VIWVGGAIAMHILGRRVLKRGDNQEIYNFSMEVNKVALRLYAPTSLILLVAESSWWTRSAPTSPRPG
jgi:hypothetical protein